MSLRRLALEMMAGGFVCLLLLPGVPNAFSFRWSIFWSSLLVAGAVVFFRRFHPVHLRIFSRATLAQLIMIALCICLAPGHRDDGNVMIGISAFGI